MRKIALFMLLAALAACRSEVARPGEDPNLITGRPWLEARPSRGTEHVHAMFIAPKAPFGIFQRASAFQAELEVFKAERNGNRIKMTFPQTGKRAEISYKIRGCDDKPPFDLCLELSGNPWGGPKRYYGMRKARRNDADADVAAITAAGDQLERELDAR